MHQLCRLRLMVGKVGSAGCRWLPKDKGTLAQMEACLDDERVRGNLVRRRAGPPHLLQPPRVGAAHPRWHAPLQRLRLPLRCTQKPSMCST